MSTIRIERRHALGREGARRVAEQWRLELERRFSSLRCRYQPGARCDRLHFEHSAATGTLTLDGDTLVVDATLGLMLVVFRDAVAREIEADLDRLLDAQADG